MNAYDHNRRWILAAVPAVLALFSAASIADTEEKPEFPKFDEVTKDMKVTDGFFTLYHDKKKDKLLARVPSSMLEKNFLWASSIAGGRTFAGWQWNDGAVYFERIGKKLVLMEADSRYEKGEKSAVTDAIKRTYTDTIIQAIPIVTLAGDDPVIDLGDLLKSDVAGVSMLFGGKPDKSLSRYATIRNFENNTNISVDMVFSGGRSGRRIHGGGGGGDGRLARIYYAFSKLPEDNGFETRRADDRVGYFLSAKKDWTVDHAAKTIFKRNIHRWRLRKAEPDKDVSDVLPEDQIVVYIEKTVPVKYRRYVRDGILEWNKAFEAAGLRNAIVVHQQTDTVHADKDPEDVRYNFIRWITSGRPFAMAPSRVNPFTGQILDTDIVIDDSYVRYWHNEFDVHGPQPASEVTDAQYLEFVSAHPDWGPPASTWTQPEPFEPPAQQFFASALKSTWGTPRDHSTCEIGKGAARRLATAALHFAKTGKGKLPDKFVGQAIRETIMHEFGHSLGLRHNFKASSWLDLAVIQNGSADEFRQITASVMDYNPYNYAASEIEQGFFATPTIGPYDYWAIEYGYKVFASDEDDEDAPKDTASMLTSIASRCAEPGLDYATDEDTSIFNPDPSVNRWDNGRDPLDFARDEIGRVERLWKDGLDWVVDDGASHARARRVFRMMMGDIGFAGRMAARLVGGQYLHRDHKGDPDARPPIVPVEADKQRDALAFLGEHIFSDEAFDFSPEMLNQLAAGRWSHWESDSMDRSLTVDVHGAVLAAQSGALFQLMNPFTINRVYDAELTTPVDQEVFGIDELFAGVSKAIWSELDSRQSKGANHTNRNPMVSSFRRSLQREHLRRMIRIVLSRPGSGVAADPHAVARLSLKRLGQSITATLDRSGDGIDDYSRAHLLDSQMRINKALEAEFTIRTARAARGRRGSFR